MQGGGTGKKNLCIHVHSLALLHAFFQHFFFLSSWLLTTEPKTSDGQQLQGVYQEEQTMR